MKRAFTTIWFHIASLKLLGGVWAGVRDGVEDGLHGGANTFGGDRQKDLGRRIERQSTQSAICSPIAAEHRRMARRGAKPSRSPAKPASTKTMRAVWSTVQSRASRPGRAGAPRRSPRRSAPADALPTAAMPGRSRSSACPEVLGDARRLRIEPVELIGAKTPPEPAAQKFECAAPFRLGSWCRRFRLVNSQGHSVAARG